MGTLLRKLQRRPKGGPVIDFPHLWLARRSSSKFCRKTICWWKVIYTKPIVAGLFSLFSTILCYTNFVVTAIPCSKKVAACAKHYVGDGGTHNGINENNTIIDTHGLLSIHMPPYYNAIIRGVSTVMVSYSSWNGVKMHANHFLVTDFLKNKLKFRVSCSLQTQKTVLFTCFLLIHIQSLTLFFPWKQGFVISDWEGIDRITTPPHANYSYSVEAGVGAGIDMVSIIFYE